MAACDTQRAAEYWRAKEACFDNIRDNAVINAMLAEIAGKQVAEGNGHDWTCRNGVMASSIIGIPLS